MDQETVETKTETTATKRPRRFIPDWYAFLRVERDASPEAIAARIAALKKLYHPVRFKAPEDDFFPAAKHRYRMLNRAAAKLSDPARRAEYDALLRRWNGSISHTGRMPIDTTVRHFAVLWLVNVQYSVALTHVIDAANKGATLDGLDLAAARTAAWSESPTPQEAETYKRALAAHIWHGVITEAQLWTHMGVQKRGIDLLLPTADENTYLMLVVAELHATRAIASRAIAVLVLDIESMQLDEGLDADTRQKVAEATPAKMRTMQENILKRYDRYARKIRSVATATAELVMEHKEFGEYLATRAEAMPVAATEEVAPTAVVPEASAPEQIPDTEVEAPLGEEPES